MKYQMTKNVALSIVFKSVGSEFGLPRFQRLHQYNIKQVIFTYYASGISAAEYGK